MPDGNDGEAKDAGRNYDVGNPVKQPHARNVRPLMHQKSAQQAQHMHKKPQASPEKYRVSGHGGQEGARREAESRGGKRQAT